MLGKVMEVQRGDQCMLFKLGVSFRRMPWIVENLNFQYFVGQYKQAVIF